ncbi:MAG TPA: HAMP domain-containing sensor histidine kinase [Rhizomicrobium sp.]|nr:HAMP domain-containing sensor histidine kinase [Rhizomicrobium sp.]
MIAQVWPLTRAATEQTKSDLRRFLRRSFFFSSHADIVRAYHHMNERTALRLFISLTSAIALGLVSTLPLSIIAIWLLTIIAVDLCCHWLRTLASQRPASRLDVPLFTALHLFLYSSWSVMPLALGFGDQAEEFISLLFQIGAMISAAQTAVRVPVCLLSVMVVAGAMLAPDIVHLLGSAPHPGAGGVLVIKLLFLLNFASLVRSWYSTARREAKLNAELEQRRQQADDLAAARAMFLAHMSHEIRSPLAGVTLLASVLKRLENVPEDQRQMIEQIDAGGQAILNLLNTVLDYSKIEAGKVTLTPKPTDIRALLDSIAGFFQLRAAETQTRFSVAIAPALPDTLMLDETRLRQVVINLVSNAVNNSPGATVELKAVYEGGVLLVDVIDTGRGVDEEMKRHLFTPREQQSVAGSGTGLGLAISRGLVDLMGGQIGFRDTQGGGATFWFRVPVPQLDGGMVS